MPGLPATALADARHYQIGVLAFLLVYGCGWLHFDVPAVQAALTITTALAVQWLGDRHLAHRPFEPRSAFISSLSLCILLRVDVPWLAMLGAAIAISSKFLITARGKHLFNPTCLALVVLAGGTSRAWVSPGQWGDGAWFGFLMACLGLLVLNRARRAETTAAFLLTYAGLVFARALWLGDPLAIPLHQLQSGALLLFAFFMISDPKTTPDSAAGRILFGVAVAVLAAALRFQHFQPYALLYALAACAPLVPLLDRWLPGARYDWRGGPPSAPRTVPPATPAAAAPRAA
ncbi:MAG: RnfABCDGE type electron transport complex subunit D [Gammaproteobacteria bacterium]